MTPKEALETMGDTTVHHIDDVGNITHHKVSDSNQYKVVLKALTELEEFKKRDTPTTPFHITSTYEGRVGNCPHCNKLVNELTVDAFNRPLHICGCGQKLDWEEK